MIPDIPAFATAPLAVKSQHGFIAKGSVKTIPAFLRGVNGVEVPASGSLGE
jgi:hypothetical protein